MPNELSASYSKALELHNKIVVSAQLAQNNLWEMCAGLKEMRDGKEYADDVEEICFCVDNDKGGEKAIEAYVQKYKDMGYIVTREIPKLKDFNEDLVNLIRPHPNILRR